MMAVIMDSIDSLSLALKELHVAGVFYWLEQPLQPIAEMILIRRIKSCYVR